MFPDLDSRSAALNTRARRCLAGGGSRSTIRTDPYTLYIREAHGAEVVDVDGNRLIDFINNYTSLIHGHSYPPIIEAVQRQLPQGSAFSFCHESELALAELLCERVPSFERIRFMNSGSEAVMNAIKLARAFTGRPKIAKCDGFYHGSYDTAEVSLIGSAQNSPEEDPRSLAYSRGTPQSVLDEVVVIPFNEPQHSQRILESHAGELSCILLDTACMRLGGNLVREDYLAMLKAVARRNDILLVYDEVISFRLGYSGSQGVLGVQPDVTALGKIIGGGFPIGAVAGRADVMSMFDAPRDGVAPLPHGGTFNANPITMAAGVAAMTDMTPDSFEKLTISGRQAREALSTVFQERGVTGQVTGVGSLFKLHLHDRPIVTLQDVNVSSDGQQIAALRSHLIDGGIFLGGGCFGCLSTATTDAHIEQLCKALAGALEKLAL
ncbi:MAG: aspartate aminotransferase family protein [Gammaproteobacteria bacterium]|nr:aspartate aminotransferase family protein [Gammaproteobacteria bacterium]